MSDELDDERIEIEDLTPKERAKVDALLKKKRCECKVCAALRKSPAVTLPKPKKAPKAKKTPKLGVKTSLSTDRTHRNVSDNDCTVLPDAVFAPSSLTSFRVQAPVTTLPDAITKLSALAKVSLYATKITRLPEPLARMPQIVDLSIGHTPLEKPADLATMPWLERLTLDRIPTWGERASEIPFGALTKLAKLQLDWVGFPAIPVAAVELASLRELVVAEPNVTELPEALLANDRLEVLELRHCGMTELPSLARLTSLRRLALAGDALVALPEDLPPNLVDLEIECAHITSLPASIGKLARLEKLYVNAQITSLPASIGKLPKLVDASFVAPLASLPSSLGKLGALRELFVRSPALASIPEDALPRGLERLNLIQCTALAALPTSLGELVNLTQLNVTASKITALPASMRKLKKLTTLRMDENADLTEIPAWIGDLRALDDLGFEKSPKIRSLPESIRKLEKLTWLLLGETAVSPLPKWLGELSLQRLYVQKTKISKEEKARLQKLLPKTEIFTR